MEGGRLFLDRRQPVCLAPLDFQDRLGLVPGRNSADPGPPSAAHGCALEEVRAAAGSGSEAELLESLGAFSPGNLGSEQAGVP